MLHLQAVPRREWSHELHDHYQEVCVLKVEEIRTSHQNQAVGVRDRISLNEKEVPNELVFEVKCVFEICVPEA
jgi:hypothetical protein